MVTDLSLCGWRLRSDLPLPELPAWSGDGREPDIAFRLGTVETHASASAAGAHGDFAADGAFLLDQPGIARYRVDGAHTVTIDPAVDPTSAALRSHLFGTVLGVLCHRRGLLPLHASACRVGSRTVLFAGPRNSGKSTLAVMLGRRGGALLADDVSAIAWADDGLPLVVPTVPCPRLTPAAVGWLGVPPGAVLEPAYGKAAVPGLMPIWPAATPVSAIVHVSLGEAHEPLRVLRREEAVGALYDCCFRGRLASRMNLGTQAFGAIVRLAARGNNFRIAAAGGFSELERLADAVVSGVLDDLAQSGAA